MRWNAMLRVALAKGRLLENFIEYLQQVNQIDIATVLLNRQRQLLLTVDNIEMILVKGSDVPTYVEQGIADVGIVGSDILNGQNIILINYSICHLVNVILRWRQSQKHLAIKSSNELCTYSYSILQ